MDVSVTTVPTVTWRSISVNIDLAKPGPLSIGPTFPYLLAKELPLSLGLFFPPITLEPFLSHRQPRLWEQLSHDHHSPALIPSFLDTTYILFKSIPTLPSSMSRSSFHPKNTSNTRTVSCIQIIPVALWSSGFCNVPRTILCSNDDCLADFLLMVTESMNKTMIARTGPRLPGPQLPSVVNNADTTLPSAATNTYTMPGLSAFLAYRQRVSQNQNQLSVNRWTWGQQNGVAAKKVRPKTKAR